jgi:hypothetical protein
MNESRRDETKTRKREKIKLVIWASGSGFPNPAKNGPVPGFQRTDTYRGTTEVLEARLACENSFEDTYR